MGFLVKEYASGERAFLTHRLIGLAVLGLVMLFLIAMCVAGEGSAVIGGIWGAISLLAVFWPITLLVTWWLFWKAWPAVTENAFWKWVIIIAMMMILILGIILDIILLVTFFIT